MDKPLRETFAKALSDWAERHPSPDKPVVSMGGPFLSPRQLAEAVKNNTPAGQSLCDMLDHAAKKTGESYEKLFARFKI